MSTIDLTAFQAKGSATVVTMPEGDEIALRPLMQLGSEHDQLLIDVITQLGALRADKDGSAPIEALGGVMPLAVKLLAAAAPDKHAARRLDRLPLMARFQVLMGYIQDQDLGGPSPSES
ncbi:hypothetical protein GCM10027294_25690 [Marinactinospora endophytica]